MVTTRNWKKWTASRVITIAQAEIMWLTSIPISLSLMVGISEEQMSPMGENLAGKLQEIVRFLKLCV